MRKNVQKTKFEAVEMILGPWNQRGFRTTDNCMHSSHRQPYSNTGCPKKFAGIWRTQNRYLGYIIYLMCRVFAHRIFIHKLKTAYYTCIV